MFSIRTLTAYDDGGFLSGGTAPLLQSESTLENAYLKAALVEQFPHQPENWNPHGLALGVAHAPRKSLFLFYLAAHELRFGQYQEAFLHTLQGIMAMETLPDLPETVLPIFRLVFLTFQTLYEGPFRREVGESLIEEMENLTYFSAPLPGDEGLRTAAYMVAARMEEDFELIPRTAKFLMDKLVV